MISPAFQFYPNDWLSSPRVALMTPAQEGAYIRLLCYDWSNDGIPTDREKLSLLARVPADASGIGGVIDCFIPHPSKPGFLTNPRLQKEREKQAEWREKSSEGGKKGAAKRWKKGTSDQNRGGHGLVKPWSSNGNDQNMTLQSSSSSSVLHERERPSLMEVLDKGTFLGLAPWKSEDWFHEMEGCGWLDFNHRPVENWQSVLTRVRTKWEADGRPMSPPARNGPTGNGKPPVYAQIKAIEKEISLSPANDQSLSYNRNATDLERQALKDLRNKLRKLNSEVANA